MCPGRAAAVARADSICSMTFASPCSDAFFASRCAMAHRPHTSTKQVLATFKQGDAAKVRTEDGEDHNLTPAETKSMIVCDPEVLTSAVDNLINLNDLTENAILHNLRIRFKVCAAVRACVPLALVCHRPHPCSFPPDN